MCLTKIPGVTTWSGSISPGSTSCSTSAKVTFAEVEEIVEPGLLDPDAIVTPGIFVTHVLKGAYYEKRIERRTVRQLQAV